MFARGSLKLARGCLGDRASRGDPTGPPPSALSERRSGGRTPSFPFSLGSNGALRDPRLTILRPWRTPPPSPRRPVGPWAGLPREGPRSDFPGGPPNNERAFFSFYNYLWSAGAPASVLWVECVAGEAFVAAARRGGGYRAASGTSRNRSGGPGARKAGLRGPRPLRLGAGLRCSHPAEPGEF